MRSRLLGTLAMSLAVLTMAPVTVLAQSPASQAPTPEPDEVRAGALRARMLARLGRVQESLAEYRRLLQVRPDDQELREDYAETLIDAGMLTEARAIVRAYLRDAPQSRRLRRLVARLDLASGHPERAAAELRDLLKETPDDLGLKADLADAEARAGHWRTALVLYDEILAREPGNAPLATARAAVAREHAPRLELNQRTIFQPSAAQYVQELAGRTWLSEAWWLRLGARAGVYEADRTATTRHVSENVETAALLAGVQLAPFWSARGGVDEYERRGNARTTGRLGGRYDDGRTVASVDAAIRELLDNPVTAVPLDATADRVTADLARRLIEGLVGAVHYAYRHYRARGDSFGDQWEAGGRAEIDVWRELVRVALVPQAFFSEFAPTPGGGFREPIPLLRHQQLVGTGLIATTEPVRGLNITLGAAGRRDVYRDLTSWEVSGLVTWRALRWLDIGVQYIRTTEGTTIGGREETIVGRLNFLF